MRIIRYFRDNIIGRLAMLSFALALFLTFVAQILIQLSYQDNLEAQIIEMSTGTLGLQSQNLYMLTKPYTAELYTTATDEAVFRYAPANQSHTIRSQSMELYALFRDRIINGHAIQALGVLYDDGYSVFYEKYDESSDFWVDASAGERVELYRRTLSAGHPVSAVNRKDLLSRRLVYVAVPLIGKSINPVDSDRVIVASVSLSFLEKTFQEMDSLSTRNYLVDADGRVLMCIDAGIIGEMIDKSAEETKNITWIDTAINTVGWRLEKRIDRDIAMADIMGDNWQTNIIYIALAFIVAGVCVLLAYNALHPIRIMAAAMKAVKGDNLGIRASVEGRDELWNTVRNFNKMMQQLEGYSETNKRYYQRIIDTERRHRSAELGMLESHINAHFLFNTLNSISYQALEAGNREVSTSTKRLANIIRYAFNSRLQNVRLYQEAAWVEQYLSIHRNRLGGKIQYEVEVEESVSDWPMRKMMLQPFVENAVIHGLNGSDNGLILIKAAKNPEGLLQIVISDNGCGMSAETYQKIDAVLRNPQEVSEFGIGLSNVAERIYSFYGPGAEITLQTEEGKGSIFKIILPWPHEKQLAAGFLEQEEDKYEIY